MKQPYIFTFLFACISTFHSDVLSQVNLFSEPYEIEIDLSENVDFILEVALFDCDADGDLDIIIEAKLEQLDCGTDCTYHTYLVRNNGNGEFSSSELVSYYWPKLWDFRRIDMDGDGIDELVCRSLSYSGLANFRIIQADDFSTTHYEWGAYSIGNVAYADLNQDGLIDCVSFDEEYQQVVSYQQPDHSFESSILPGNLSSDIIGAADIDADGDMDIITGKSELNPSEQDAITIRQNFGGNIDFNYVSNFLEDRPSAWLIFDFNEDGRDDILARISDSVTPELHLSLALPGAEPVYPAITSDTYFHYVAPDLFGDGNNEFVEFDTETLKVYYRNGSSMYFVHEENYNSLRFHHFEDFNSDGKSDWLYYDTDNQVVGIRWNIYDQQGCSNPNACNYVENPISEAACNFECVNNIDTNSDGIVNIIDLLDFLTNLGCIGPDCVSDFNQDGITTIADLFLLLSWFGESP